MNRLVPKLAVIAAVGIPLFSNPIVAQTPAPQAQIPPPAKKAEHVEIIKGPALEIAHDDLAIIRWITNNPRRG
ncbi:MAG TPA: hypothetical protein VGJ20_04870 [Xanthobacteraceae bacterium]|jgi:hypothetical protein